MSKRSLEEHDTGWDPNKRRQLDQVETILTHVEFDIFCVCQYREGFQLKSSVFFAWSQNDMFHIREYSLTHCRWIYDCDYPDIQCTHVISMENMTCRRSPDAGISLSILCDNGLLYVTKDYGNKTGQLIKKSFDIKQAQRFHDRSSVRQSYTSMTNTLSPVTSMLFVAETNSKVGYQCPTGNFYGGGWKVPLTDVEFMTVDRIPAIPERSFFAVQRGMSKINHIQLQTTKDEVMKHIISAVLSEDWLISDLWKVVAEYLQDRMSTTTHSGYPYALDWLTSVPDGSLIGVKEHYAQYQIEGINPRDISNPVVFSSDQTFYFMRHASVDEHSRSIFFVARRNELKRLPLPARLFVEGSKRI